MAPHLLRRAPSAALVLFAACTAAAAQSPCVDVNALLDAISFRPGGTRAQFLGATGAFFPESALYRGQAESTIESRPYLVLETGGQEIGRWKCTAHPAGKVFHRIQGFGSTLDHDFTEAGDYVLSVQIDRQPITTLPFTVALESSGDPFDPKTSVVSDAELFRWGMLTTRLHGDDRDRVELTVRLRSSDLEVSEDAEIRFLIQQEGRTIYEAGKVRRSVLPTGSHWHELTKSVQFPKGQGGGAVGFADLVKRDGTYRVVLTAEGKTLRAYEYHVRDGRLEPHARSSFEHRPATEYLLTRVPMGENRGFREMTWLEPLATPATSDARPTVAPGAAAAPTAGARARWAPSDAPPARASRVVVTDVNARVDANLAAGEGIVAYGTGANTGVAYLDVASNVERTFPGGVEVSSKVFFVCGRKLVLVKGRQVLIHDTASGATVEIPLTDVYLKKVPTRISKGRSIDADGMLVAVLCDPTKTADRRSVKVIDLTGDTPTIVGLGFPEAAPEQLASIGVGAAAGQVVVGSDRTNAIYVANVAEDAPFRTHSLAGHDGFSADCVPLVREGAALVFDAAGTRKLRRVDLATGAVTTLAPLAKAERLYGWQGGRIALAGDESHGSSYGVLIGDAAGPIAPPSGSGEDCDSGKRGFGQRVAVSSEGLVFTSGDGAGGIGSGELLFVSDGTGWEPVLRDGKALAAVDVHHGRHLVAFKTGKARKAVVGYVLLGAGAGPGALAVQ